MKKTSRQVVRNWAATIAGLKPGQVLEVTSRGKTLVHITRPPEGQRRPLPDFEKEAKALGFSRAVGNRLLKRLLAEDEAIS